MGLIRTDGGTWHFWNHSCNLHLVLFLLLVQTVAILAQDAYSTAYDDGAMSSSDDERFMEPGTLINAQNCIASILDLHNFTEMFPRETVGPLQMGREQVDTLIEETEKLHGIIRYYTDIHEMLTWESTREEGRKLFEFIHNYPNRHRAEMNMRNRLDPLNTRMFPQPWTDGKNDRRQMQQIIDACVSKMEQHNLLPQRVLAFNESELSSFSFRLPQVNLDILEGYQKLLDNLVQVHSTVINSLKGGHVGTESIEGAGIVLGNLMARNSNIAVYIEQHRTALSRVHLITTFRMAQLEPRVDQMIIEAQINAEAIEKNARIIKQLMSTLALHFETYKNVKKVAGLEYAKYFDMDRLEQRCVTQNPFLNNRTSF